MYKQDMSLNNLQGLICHKTQPTNSLLLSLLILTSIYFHINFLVFVISIHLGCQSLAVRNDANWK